MRTEQVYFNCPKYIQSRHLTTVPQEQAPPQKSSRIYHLSPQPSSVASTTADTFFIASAHTQRGADASHRGGLPGFIQVLDARHFAFPDYAGNTMFQTLGNLVTDPRAGLLFIDFENGNVLQLTGRARVIWKEERRDLFAGVERLIRV